MRKKRSLNFRGVKAVVVTISDSCAGGRRRDETGELLSGLLKEKGAILLKKEIIADDEVLIKDRLKFFCDGLKADLILSCGGTGFGPRDLTPEATKAIIEKEACGLSELIRLKGLKKTDRAALSRGICGIRGGALIVNLPGSPKGAGESFRAIIEVIPHALAMIRGEGH